MAFGAVAFVALAFAYIAWPVGHIPLYDANLTRLAETDLQGYCSGDAFLKSGGYGSASKASECRRKLKKQRPDKPSITAVTPAFCQAIVDGGWEGTQQQCIDIMAQNEYWPTYDGGVTNAWNRARPYPKAFLPTDATGKRGTSRTGDRSGNSRTNNPTHETPTFGP